MNKELTVQQHNGALVSQETHSANVADLIKMALMTPEITADKLTSLYDLQQRVKQQDAEEAFNRDFAKLQLALPRIPKNGIIDMGAKGKMNFAKWEDMDAAIRPILNAHGFVLSFSSKPVAGAVLMVCTLTHVQGHSRSSEMQLPPDAGAGRNGLQAIGSSRSYGKRYLTQDILNLVTEGQDNDGSRAEPISQDQIDTIHSLLAEIGSTPSDGRFTKWLRENFNGVDAVHRIQKPQFEDVIRGLEQKRRKP